MSGDIKAAQAKLNDRVAIPDTHQRVRPSAPGIESRAAAVMVVESPLRIWFTSLVKREMREVPGVITRDDQRYHNLDERKSAGSFTA